MVQLLAQDPDVQQSKSSPWRSVLRVGTLQRVPMMESAVSSQLVKILILKLTITKTAKSSELYRKFLRDLAGETLNPNPS